MTNGGINKWTSPWKSGGITRFSLSVENEQADAAETVLRDQLSGGANGNGDMFIFPVQMTTSRIGNLTRVIHTLL